MTLFLRRFIGVLVLDASAFEEIEANRHAAMQSVMVVILVCCAGGVAALGFGQVGLSGFVAGTLVSLGAWLVWAAVMTTLGTMAMAEPQTHSNLPELLRVLAFASAPAVFVALAAMPAVMPVVLITVTAWAIAAAVIGVRQALDYQSTPRAIAVCLISGVVSFGLVLAVLMMFSQNVS